mmetsp:Transcript_134533/g.335666  ORF Transcript_134533/g.335666 Transcript_134533/m.335666 type:complete len:410 (-) Transcript_134533:484-1713(-)
MSVQGPQGPIPKEKVLELFDQVGFEPPPGMPLQEALMLLLSLMQKREMRQSALPPGPPPKGRTAIPCSREDVGGILEAFGATLVLIEPCGAEVKGVDLVKGIDPRLAGALEMVMADYGLVLFRGQGTPQKEMGIEGKYLTGNQQCEVSLAFGKGALHSTHGNHDECPNRDIFRLSNNAKHGFNEVGPEWHNDGSFCRDVFSYVVYHIIKAPAGPGNTAFAHLGKAHDLLSPHLQENYAQCASVNSNGGVVHPLVHTHRVSGRKSLYLHTGMTGAILERVAPPSGGGQFDGVKAWSEPEVNELMCSITDLLDREDVSYNHKWQEGDVIIIDNLAVAHKAMPGAHTADSGLRILHRTTCLGVEPLDPRPELSLPISLDTAGPCPFKGPNVAWVEGYVGFRWGDWRSRSVPH